MTIDLTELVQRIERAAVLVPSVERHLLEDQTDAIALGGNAGGGGKTGHSNPTPHLASILAPFVAKERSIRQAVDGIGKAIDHLERTCTAAIANRRVDTSSEPRCPGWSPELRARLGGCGKVIEFYRDARGVAHNRASGLCTGCRKAQERAEDDAA